MTSGKTLAAAVGLALVLSACGGAATSSSQRTVAYIPNYAQGGPTPTPAVLTSAPSNVIQVSLGDTSPTQMFIHLSQPYAQAGPVSFLITNTSTTMKHELVGFATKTPAADYPITGFEGDPNRIDEDRAGTVVVDTGAALSPGASKLITTTLAPGHYALVCNLSGHYRAGMHADFWVMPKG